MADLSKDGTTIRTTSIRASNFIQEQPKEKSTKIVESRKTLLKNFFRVKKPLIPLKVSLFLWYGGASAVQPFLQAYLKQLGISVTQLSIIYIINPIVQAVGPTVSGLVADKIGRSKPVLLANLIITLLLMNLLLLLPAVDKKQCTRKEITFHCSLGNSVISTFNECAFDNQTLVLKNCSVQCEYNGTLDDIHSHCLNTNNSSCDNVTLGNSFQNVVFYVQGTKSNGSCYNDITNVPFAILNFCNYVIKQNCTVSCPYEDYYNMSFGENCSAGGENMALVFAICCVLMLLWSSFVSTTYRFMDITAMSMVKTHNSDFGRERFWSILGIAIMSPLSGYLVDVTTPPGSSYKNYVTAFYIFDGFIILTIISLYKLDVHIEPPGTDMWKKIKRLLRNADILIFICIVFVLGSTWSFKNIYCVIYLQGLGAPGILLGLIQTVSSVVGLPFLFTSNWWVKKMGSSTLLMFAFLAYIYACVGYAYIINPWYALIFEISQVFTYHLLWVAVVRRSHELAPAGLTATVISSAGGIHYATGKGGGSLVGGLTMGKYGGPVAFKVMATICGITAIIYGSYLFTQWWRNKKQLSVKKGSKEKNAESDHPCSVNLAKKTQTNL